MCYTQRLYSYVIIMIGFLTFAIVWLRIWTRMILVSVSISYVVDCMRLLYAILERRLDGTVCHFGAKVKEKCWGEISQGWFVLGFLNVKYKVARKSSKILFQSIKRIDKFLGSRTRGISSGRNDFEVLSNVKEKWSEF